MPPREKLNERIHARADAMLAQGWMREVQALLESGLSEDSKPFDFIGYRELRAVLRSEMTVEEARRAIQQATRRYAKRQLTWFRKELGVHWFQVLAMMPACKQPFSNGFKRRASRGKNISDKLACRVQRETRFFYGCFGAGVTSDLLFPGWKAVLPQR